jgi:hypothetical protein
MKRFRDQSQGAKSACRIAEDTSAEAWLYCDKCHRAMAQGDCIVDDCEGVLRCAYADCDPGGNLAYRSLYGWDAYRQAHELETVGWPTEPVRDRCYRSAARPA